jgi:hypothetical protein
MTPAIIVVATLASYALGWVLSIPILVPFLNTLASFPFMVLALKRGDIGRAIVRMLVWAATLGVCATLLSYVRPVETARLFVRAAAYRNEMVAWVLTGRGAESTPSAFIPQQAGQAAVFCALGLASGGTLAMPMGAVLMNDMGHYVGTLAAMSRRPLLTMVLAWHPWAVIRIASFVAIGVILSAPLLARVFGFRMNWTSAATPLAVAGAGLVTDVALKWLLAPAWQQLLLRLVTG